MEIRVLRYFLTVTREQNITKAAEVLHITQPTLSRQLTELEEYLGVKLFVRGHRKITLTEAGILLRRRAEEIVELADKTEREFGEEGEDVSGLVSIGSAESMAARILPELLESFSQKYPQVQYELYSGNADLIKERIDKGLIDIGLLLEPVDIEKYDFIRLKQKERWGIIMRADSPLAAKDAVEASDLKHLPLSNVKRTVLQNELSSWFGEDYKNLNTFSTHNMSALAALLAERGLVYALAIEGSVSIYQTPNICFRPLYPELTATSVFVWKKYQPFNLATTKFIKMIKDTF